jgi:hypothetical protein
MEQICCFGLASEAQNHGDGQGSLAESLSYINQQFVVALLQNMADYTSIRNIINYYSYINSCH